MLTCETDYLKMCNRSFKIVKYVISKMLNLNRCDFCKTSSQKWNVGSKNENNMKLNCELVKLIISKCVKVYFERVKYVIWKMWNWNICDFCERSQWKVKFVIWKWKQYELKC